jgi:transposase-like protein
MNIDSIKIRLPVECLVNYKEIAFDTITTDSMQLPGSKIQYKLNTKKPLGLKDIVLNQTQGYATLEMSAKILKENYFSLLNLNTIENAFDNVNASGLIQLNIPSSVENAAVLRCDVTTDLHIQDIPKHLRSLSAYRINRKYDCKVYPSSVVFNRNVTTKALKEYQTFYCKATDMKKKDRELLKYVSIKDAKNVLRCESRYANFQQIRNAIEGTDLSLLSVLQSEAKPNLKIFNRITQEIDPADYYNIQNFQALIDMKQAYKHKDIQKEIAMASILKMCNFDIELVKVYLATNSTANNSRLLKQFKSRLKAKNEIDTGSIENDMNEIRGLLNAA